MHFEFRYCKQLLIAIDKNVLANCFRGLLPVQFIWLLIFKFAWRGLFYRRCLPQIRTATTEPMSEAETAIVYDSSPALEAANELPLPPLPPLRQQHRPHLTRRCLSPNELTSQVQTPIGRYNSPRRAASVVARQSISLSLQALFTPTRVGEEPRSSSSCSSVRNARHGSPDEREGLEYCSQVVHFMEVYFCPKALLMSSHGQ